LLLKYRKIIFKYICLKADYYKENADKEGKTSRKQGKARKALLGAGGNALSFLPVFLSSFSVELLRIQSY